VLRVVRGAVVVQVDAPHARSTQTDQPKAQVSATITHHGACGDGRLGVCGESQVKR